MTEIAEGCTVDQVKAATGCKLTVVDNLQKMRLAGK